ncbi:hypothetical protein HJC99_04105 [Candidatus Saccharibacteria bacterium]|nr:hypothetical protein [Candidatus Saccharibacteria bacterium]
MTSANVLNQRRPAIDSRPPSIEELLDLAALRTGDKASERGVAAVTALDLGFDTAGQARAAWWPLVSLVYVAVIFHEPLPLASTITPVEAATELGYLSPIKARQSYLSRLRVRLAQRPTMDVAALVVTDDPRLFGLARAAGLVSGYKYLPEARASLVRRQIA